MGHSEVQYTLQVMANSPLSPTGGTTAPLSAGSYSLTIVSVPQRGVDLGARHHELDLANLLEENGSPGMRTSGPSVVWERLAEGGAAVILGHEPQPLRHVEEP